MRIKNIIKWLKRSNSEPESPENNSVSISIYTEKQVREHCKDTGGVRIYV